VISFFSLICHKTLNAFLLSLCLPEERNFLAQKTTRKEGFVWSSGQNVIFTTTTQLNHRKEYDYFYSFRRFNESMRSVVLVLVVV
jgi:c-di-GMP-binding flagellar brake protein YcgR